MKLAALLLLCCSLPALADSNTPTDEVIKQQFAEQSDGILRLNNLSLRQLSAVGNQATYSIEGDVASTDNLYSMVGMAADYLFYERTWFKGQPVKFSAMMTAVGTQGSGWRTEFFSMQMAAKNTGRPFSEREDLSKILVINDSRFMSQFAALDKRFAEGAATLQKQQAQQETLEKELAKLDKQLNGAWSTDANGRPSDRSTVQQEMLEKMYAVDRQNDPLKFENHYNQTVYEPALAECQKKPDCDSARLRTARDAALAKQKDDYYRQHKMMSDNIKQAMEKGDKNNEPLRKKQGELRSQLVALDNSSSELARESKRWREGVDDMRRKGIIH